MRRNVLPKFIKVVWRRHVGAHPDGLQHGGREPIETSVTEFWYKSVYSSLEELKNFKITLFLTRYDSQIPTVTFLTNMTALLAVV